MRLCRLAMRVLPVFLTGCTVLSGVAALEIGTESGSGPNPLSGPDAASTSDDGDASPPGEIFSPNPDKPAKDASADDPIEDEGGLSPIEAGVDAGTVTATFSDTLRYGQLKTYGPFRAAGGTTFEARTTGSGDGDLYLRFDQPVAENRYECESDNSGANERCRRTVPAAGSDVHLLVYAYDNCSYTLTVAYLPGP